MDVVDIAKKVEIKHLEKKTEFLEMSYDLAKSYNETINKINSGELKRMNLMTEQNVIQIRMRDIREEIRQSLERNYNLQNDLSAATQLQLELEDKIGKLKAKFPIGSLIVQKYELQLNDILSEKNKILNRQSDIHSEITKKSKEYWRIQGDFSTRFTRNLLNSLESFQVLKNLGFANVLEGVEDKIVGWVNKLSMFRKIAGATLTFLAIEAFKFFRQYDKSFQEIRKSFGLFYKDSQAYARLLKDTTIELADFGATYDDVQKTIVAIGKDFGKAAATNKDLVKQTTLISLQLGVSAEKTSKFLKTLMAVQGTSLDMRDGLIGFTQEIGKANPNLDSWETLMNDISESSDETRIFIGQSSISMVKAASEARKMGISLNEAATSSKKLLNFQDSIAAEMEASVLLGKDINLQKARDLAYSKDIIGANKEILRLAQEVNFDAMDPFQAESFAAATGKSVRELQEMVRSEEQMRSIRMSSDKSIQEQLKKYDELVSLSEAQARNVGLVAEEEFKRQYNQQRLNQLTNQWNKLLMELSGPLMEIAEPLIDIATKILPPMLIIIKSGVLGIFAIGKAFKFIGKGLSWVSSLASILTFLRPIAFIALKIGTTFGRMLTPIGWVITAVMSISEIFKSWKKYMSDFEGPLWQKILRGIGAVAIGIGTAILGPFKDAWDWCAKHWFGNSPSKAGELIFIGIKSVASMIFNALTTPFRMAFDFISGLFGGPKLQEIFDKKLGVAVDVSGTKTENDKTRTEFEPLIQAINDGNAKIVQRLDHLIDIFESGKVGVSMDGTKVGALVKRAETFRGAFGSN